MAFAGLNNESVKFIIQCRVRGQACLEQAADIFVTVRSFGKTMALQDSASVGIHDKDGMLGGVQKNRVCGFRPYAVNSEELFAERERGGAKHSRQGTLVLGPKEIDEGLELFRFLPKVSGRTNQALKTRTWNPVDRAWRESSFTAQIFDARFNVGP